MISRNFKLLFFDKLNLEHFSIDTGFIPDRVAQDYGFNSFEDFVNDDQMKTVVKVEIVDDQPVYVPRDCSRFRHIRDEQIYSNETTVKK